MKWFVLALLTLNLILAYLNWQSDLKKQKLGKEVVENVGNIMLLEPADEGGGVSVDDKPNADPVEPVGNTTSSDGEGDGNSTLGQYLEASGKIGSSTEKPVDKTTEKHTRSEQKKVDGEVDAVSSEGRNNNVNDVLAGIESEDARKATCGTLGPVREESVAQFVKDTLREQSIETALRRESIKEEAGFWVIIPPFDDRQMAIDTVTRLKELGVSDIWRFYRGEYKNGVSLGMYSRRKNAEQRRDSIIGLGYLPEVVPRFRDVEQHWIDYRIAKDRDAPDFKSIFEEVPGLTNSESQCTHIATDGGIF